MTEVMRGHGWFYSHPCKTTGQDALFVYKKHCLIEIFGHFRFVLVVCLVLPVSCFLFVYDRDNIPI